MAMEDQTERVSLTAAGVVVLRTKKSRANLGTERKENCVVLTANTSSEPGH